MKCLSIDGHMKTVPSASWENSYKSFCEDIFPMRVITGVIHGEPTSIMSRYLPAIVLYMLHRFADTEIKTTESLTMQALLSPMSQAAARLSHERRAAQTISLCPSKQSHVKHV